MARQEEELERSLLETLDEFLREQGWSPHLDDAGYHRVDALTSRTGECLAIALKARRDARRSLLRPMLAEAMLTASAACVAKSGDQRWRPLALVGAPRITGDMIAHLRGDVRELQKGMRGAAALGVAWGVIDGTGRVLLEGEGLHLERPPSLTSRKPPRVPEPFTDRGQRVLKMLMAPLLKPGHFGAMADRYSSANALARAAAVSVSTAADVVRLLREKGHLSDSDGTFELHRLPELLESWKHRLSGPSASTEAEFKRPTSDPEGRLRDALRRFRGKRGHAAQAFAPPDGPGLLSEAVSRLPERPVGLPRARGEHRGRGRSHAPRRRRIRPDTGLARAPAGSRRHGKRARGGTELTGGDLPRGGEHRRGSLRRPPAVLA